MIIMLHCTTVAPIGRDIDTYIDIVHHMHSVDIRIDRQCRVPQCTFHHSGMGSICRALITIKITNTLYATRTTTIPIDVWLIIVQG